MTQIKQQNDLIGKMRQDEAKAYEIERQLNSDMHTIRQALTEKDAKLLELNNELRQTTVIVEEYQSRYKLQDSIIGNQQAVVENLEQKNKELISEV